MTATPAENVSNWSQYNIGFRVRVSVRALIIWIALMPRLLLVCGSAFSAQFCRVKEFEF